jgi:hypothetical protein
VKGNTGPFWIGSGFALLSALIVLVGVRPLSHDGMMEEDEKVSFLMVEVSTVLMVFHSVPCILGGEWL